MVESLGTVEGKGEGEAGPGFKVGDEVFGLAYGGSILSLFLSSRAILALLTLEMKSVRKLGSEG